MKKLVFSVLFMVLSIAVFGQTKPIVTTFKVSGNCGMCKSTIEGSLKDVKGVSSAVWNKDTKEMKVEFTPKKITLEQIMSTVAATGYDTEKVKAKDEDYNKLHGCCKYARAKN